MARRSTQHEPIRPGPDRDLLIALWILAAFLIGVMVGFGYGIGS